MNKTIPSPVKQREALKIYLRTLRANYNRAAKELNASFSRRTRYPFENNLRYQRYEQALGLLHLGEACLADLNHAYALRLAAFKPGDQIIATLTVKGYPETQTRYAIVDVEWRKGDGQAYVVRQITKKGTLHAGHREGWIGADGRHRIDLCLEALADETTRYLDARRRWMEDFLVETIEKGDLKAYEVKQYPLGGTYVQRKYR